MDCAPAISTTWPTNVDERSAFQNMAPVLQVYLAGSFEDKGSLVALLKAAGALLLSRIPIPQNVAESEVDPPLRTSLVMWDSCVRQKSRNLTAGVCNVATAWLLDSASRFEVQPLSGYTLQ